MRFDEFKIKAKELGLSDKKINEFKNDSLNIDYQMFYDVLEPELNKRVYKEKDGHIVDESGKYDE